MSEYAWPVFEFAWCAAGTAAFIWLTRDDLLTWRRLFLYIIIGPIVPILLVIALLIMLSESPFFDYSVFRSKRDDADE